MCYKCNININISKYVCGNNQQWWKYNDCVCNNGIMSIYNVMTDININKPMKMKA